LQIGTCSDDDDDDDDDDVSMCVYVPRHTVSLFICLCSLDV